MAGVAVFGGDLFRGHGQSRVSPATAFLAQITAPHSETEGANRSEPERASDPAVLPCENPRDASTASSRVRPSRAERPRGGIDMDFVALLKCIR
jgi:hypothetical protein